MRLICNAYMLWPLSSSSFEFIMLFLLCFQLLCIEVLHRASFSEFFLLTYLHLWSFVYSNSIIRFQLGLPRIFISWKNLNRWRDDVFFWTGFEGITWARVLSNTIEFMLISNQSLVSVSNVDFNSDLFARSHLVDTCRHRLGKSS